MLLKSIKKKKTNFTKANKLRTDKNWLKTNIKQTTQFNCRACNNLIVNGIIINFTPDTTCF